MNYVKFKTIARVLIILARMMSSVIPNMALKKTYSVPITFTE